MLIVSWTFNAYARCEDPAAELHFSTSNGESLDFSGVTVEREDERVDLHGGMPLCEGDIVRTSENSQALLKLGSADEDQFDITLQGEGSVEVLDLNRIQLFFGSIFADLENRFDVVMPFGLLGATGTAYELSVDEDGFRVDQVEGTTVFIKDNVEVQTIETTRSYRRKGDSQTLDQLEQSRCRSLVDANSNFVINNQRRTQTALPTDIDSALLEPNRYTETRGNALCIQNAEAQSVLGRAAIALGNPDRGLEVLDTDSNQPNRLISIGRAWLQRGEPEKAIDIFRTAVKAWPNNLAAHLGLGDALSDLGLTKENTDDSRRNFAEAERTYTNALNTMASKKFEQASIHIKLGNLQILKAPLVSPAQSDRALAMATAQFEKAMTLSDLPHAKVGLANIQLARAQQIPTQVMERGELSLGQHLIINGVLAALAERQRKPLREKARDLLSEVISSHPEFAPALVTLGEVEYELGDRDEARATLRNAMSADPTYRQALGAYAKIGPQRRLYRNAYRTFEFRAARKIEEKKRNLMLPEVVRTTIPSTSLTPDITKISFDQPQQTEGITWTNRGESDTRVSETRLRGDQRFFSIVSDTCDGQRISPGRSCSIDILFDPRDTNDLTFDASLRIEGDGGQWKRDIEIRGHLDQRPIVQ